MPESKQAQAADGETSHTAAGDKRKPGIKNPEAKRAKTEGQRRKHGRSQISDDEIPETNDKLKREDVKDEGDTPKPSETGAGAKGQGAIRPGELEEADIPSNMLEKGIIYFFIRGRVNVDEPSGVSDIARSYIILRPIAKDAKLGKGPIGDAGNARLIALPKKVLPLSGKDRFMAFIEKSGTSYDELKGQFLAGKEYETKTAGTRHTPAATPIGEGIYAITTTERESHLVYMITLPEELGEVQKELGLRERASFILSTKNPKYPGPGYARLPQGPKYPKRQASRIRESSLKWQDADWYGRVLDDFRDLRWIPSKPAHLDYANAQLLLIGERTGIDKAMEVQKEDEKRGGKEPIEVLEQLEEEDLARMRHLPGDQSASVFADLKAHADDYPKIQTTF